MRLIRSILFNLGMLAITPVFSVLAILLFPLPAVLHSRIVSSWAYLAMFWLKVTCGLSFRVIGKENIFPPQIWVMKRSLLWIPFLGWAFAALRAIAIDRAAGREALKQMVDQGMDRLAKGLWVVIFPEGTRIAPGKKGKYHIGGAWLATHTKATVVPVAHNAGEFWRKNSFLKTPGVITVSIGEPIETTGLKPDAVNQMVEAWIESEMPLLRSR